MIVLTTKKVYSMSIKRVWLDESENECIVIFLSAQLFLL